MQSIPKNNQLPFRFNSGSYKFDQVDITPFSLWEKRNPIKTVITHMNRIFSSNWIIVAFLGFFSLALSGQTCNYGVTLYDSQGDGWSGGVLVVRVGTVSKAYALAFANPDSSTYNFAVKTGDSINITWIGDIFPQDMSFKLFDNDGSVLIKADYTQDGLVYSGVANCVSCPRSLSLNIDRITGNTARVRWAASTNATRYRLRVVEGGTPVSSPGQVFTTSSTTQNISGLKEKKPYDVYIKSYCTGADSSNWAGPYSFSTFFNNDVGIVAIESPNSGCGISQLDSVAVRIKNFGSRPQSLFSFFYSVNGQAVSIPTPNDGFFTQILGRDSTFKIAFKTLYDFSSKGDYIIRAWTEMESDSNRLNDTATFVLTNISTIDRFPYSENFESGNGGWTVSIEGQKSSWALGQPSGTLLTSASSGENAWVTNLNGAYPEGELSYLLSPCMDFGNLNADPEISFNLWLDTESFGTGLTFEGSLDGGKTWKPVGRVGTGNGWHNDSLFTGLGTGFPIWNSKARRWAFASNTLIGYAGQRDVRFRFSFDGRFNFTNAEGVGIDNIYIGTRPNTDIQLLSIGRVSNSTCGVANDRVRFTVFNNGNTPISNFSFNYQVNGAQTITQNIAGPIQPLMSFTGSATGNFASNNPGVTTRINAWVFAVVDDLRSNDSSSLKLELIRALPLKENFDSGFLPAGWVSTSSQNPITSTRGNKSFVLTSEIFGGNFAVRTPAYGIISANDSLIFDYRLVSDFNGNEGFKFEGADKIILEVSSNCGTSFTVLDEFKRSNHDSTFTGVKRKSYSLGSFAGQNLLVRWRSEINDFGTFGYFDLDNINIKGCPPSLEATLVGQFIGGTNGQLSAFPRRGQAPYVYRWSTGQTTNENTIRNLPAGVYTVTITDANNCSQVLTRDLILETGDLGFNTNWNVFPNPTSGQVSISVEELGDWEGSLDLMDMMGRTLFSEMVKTNGVWIKELNLMDINPGVYFIRLRKGNSWGVKKLIVNR
jgi:hypothetical protein